MAFNAEVRQIELNTCLGKLEKTASMVANLITLVKAGWYVEYGLTTYDKNTSVESVEVNLMIADIGAANGLQVQYRREGIPIDVVNEHLATLLSTPPV